MRWLMPVSGAILLLFLQSSASHIDLDPRVAHSIQLADHLRAHLPALCPVHNEPLTEQLYRRGKIGDPPSEVLDRYCAAAAANFPYPARWHFGCLVDSEFVFPTAPACNSCNDAYDSYFGDRYQSRSR